MTAREAHSQSIAQFEGRRFCSRAEAARYLDISDRYLDELLYSQRIRSRYVGRRRKVEVSSLLEYADDLPIDPPGHR